MVKPSHLTQPPKDAPNLSQFTLLSFISPSPAHGVVVLRVTEAGSFQLTAHHCAGALVTCQVALQTTLAVYTRPWDTVEEVQKTRVKIRCEISCLLRSVFTFVSIDHKHSWHLNIPWLYHDLFIVWMLAESQILMAHCHKGPFSSLPFLTMLLHVVSVPRSLSPEGNYRLCFSLVVQRFHTACSIGAAKEEHFCVTDKHTGFHICSCFIHVSWFKNTPLVIHISE